MTLQEAQQNVDQWIKTTGVRYFSELTNMAILTEEVGEVGETDEPHLRRSVIQGL
jgi:NTP pyrophosphatase (non-canonical NTP hydrolase)